jgi:hypothetical protein
LSELTPRRQAAPGTTGQQQQQSGGADEVPSYRYCRLFVLFVVLIVGYSSVFTVAQTEQVLVVRLGEPIRVVTEPGLNFKAPFIDTVISIDKRILDLENPSQEVIASDQKRLVVDAFARYRIKNALRFYQSVGSIQAANIQLTTLLNAALRRVLGEVTFITVVRDQREALMARIREQLDKEADGYGIQVVDVGSGGPTCRNRTVRRSTSACRPSGSAKPPNSARKAARRRRRPGPMPIAKRPSSSPKPIRPPNRCAAPATPSATGCSPRPMARTRFLRVLPLDERVRDRAEEQRYPLPAAAGLGFLQVLQQLVRQAARGGCAPGDGCRAEAVRQRKTATKRRSLRRC